MQIQLTDPQSKMFMSQAPFPAMVSGFGAGKSETLIVCALRDLFQFPGGNIGIYSPTVDLNYLNLVPRFETMLNAMGASFTHNKTRGIIKVHGYGDLIFRSLDNPHRIIAYEVLRSHVDELDTLPKSKAEEAWNKIISRNRQTLEKYPNATNRVSCYTTPEGFRFVYEKWKRDPAPGYELIQAKTESNPYLPKDYIPNLYNTYPSQLIKAYLNGEFVNLTSDTVCYAFDRTKHDCCAEYKEGETLHIGQDFNVYKQFSSIQVKRDNIWFAIDEFVDLLDTPETIDRIKSKYPKSRIIMYPDASGSSRHSVNASISDISLLKDAGFTIMAKSRNPNVKDRVAAANKIFEDNRMFVNTTNCPRTAECLEQLTYREDGSIDKKSGKDHGFDAFSYPIIYNNPIFRPVANPVSLGGF